MESETIIGIDLGTTNSCVAIWRNQKLEVIPDGHDRTIPSVVAFYKNHRYVGKEAKNQLDVNPKNTIYDVKRIIGRRFSDPVVQEEIGRFSYIVTSGGSDDILIKLENAFTKPYLTPEEISAIVLTKLKLMAEEYLGHPVQKAVVTIPAYFNDAQRQATKDAATIAGLECIRMINEPTSAALAYGLSCKKDHNVMVYDLGGGTLDVSLLNIDEGFFEVLATDGNSHLGGEDFDNRLVNYCLSEFKKENEETLLSELEPEVYQRMKKACENAKKILSSNERAFVCVDDICDGDMLRLVLDRGTFDRVCNDLFVQAMEPVQEVLRESGLGIDQVDEIILVGGATRMPKIQEMLTDYFQGKVPYRGVNPDEVVAMGAAIQAFMLGNKDDAFSQSMTLIDRTPLTLGVETIGEVMTPIIPRNATIPTTKSRKFTVDSDYETDVTIRIFEGERKMTKDNFLVGEFELGGLESAPKGVVKIDVEFHVDQNGIVSVRATDSKTGNSQGIVVSGNKGRLSAEELEQLVLEAQEAELGDRVLREKVQMQFELDGICRNVINNLDSDGCGMSEQDQEKIREDVERVLEWLHNQEIGDVDPDALKNRLHRLKKNYGTLVLQIQTDENMVEAARTGDETGVDIFGDDEEEGNYNMEDGEYDVVKQERREIKKNLEELCHNILSIVSSPGIKLSSEDVNELTDYIDHVLMWIHVKDDLGVNDYIDKINEVNEMSNLIMSKYDSLFEELDDEELDREELEHLVGQIQLSLDVVEINDELKEALEEKINEAHTFLESNESGITEATSRRVVKTIKKKSVKRGKSGKKKKIAKKIKKKVTVHTPKVNICRQLLSELSELSQGLV